MLAPDGPVHPTPTARSLAAAILRPPLAPVVTRGPVARAPWPCRGPLGALLARVPSGVVTPLLVPAIGLLPDRPRGYGFAWGTRERLLEAWLVAGWRAWRPLSRSAGAGSPGPSRPSVARGRARFREPQTPVPVRVESSLPTPD